MATRPVNILMVEDSADDAELVLLALKRSGLTVICERVASAGGLRAALANQNWDVILSDFALPGFGGVAALRIVRGFDPDLPFIVVSGTIGEDFAVEIMREEASDYVLKSNLVRLPPAIRREVREAGNRHARRKAEAEARHLAAIVQSSEDAIASYTLDGTISSWNAAAERMFGWTAIEAIGKPIIDNDLTGSDLSCHSEAEAVCGDRADEVVHRSSRMLYASKSSDQLDPMMKLVREDESFTTDHRRQRIDGSFIDIHRTVSPIRDHSGRVVGLSGISRDVTARKQAERNLQQEIIQRDQFMATQSHELRNPLGAILNAAELLDGLPLNGEPLAACQLIRRQAEQMRLLLDDLLDVARITQNKISLHLQNALLSDIVSEAIAVVRQFAISRDQLLEGIGFELTTRVDGDPARLHQVFVNLLKNACKYSPPGEIIHVSLSEENGQAIVRVKDKGIGISAEMLDRVFHLFVQCDEALDRADGGMGIGLTLVKAIVELHGGVVSATSNGLGTGSEFTVSLPRLAGPAPTKVPSVTGGTAKNRARCFRVAILEDNADSRTILQSLLQLDGHEVRTARNGVQGIQLICDWHPDLALVDIGLPDLDGCEVAERVRANQLDPVSCLVALTGHGSSADRQRVLAAGFDSHLIKPLRRADLDAVLLGLHDR